MSTSPDRPTVGVFIPNRNHAALVTRAMEAVRRQSRPADQWIVVDDASTDDSPRVLRDYAASCAAAPELIFHAVNRGVIPTFAEVLPRFRTDYLYPAAADDHALPGFFEKALAAAEAHPGVGVIFGEMEVRDPEGRLLSVTRGPWRSPTHLTPEKFLNEFLMRESPMRAFGCAILYQTDALREMDIARFVPLGHGYDNFLWRAIALKYGAFYIPEPLGAWCVQPGSISQSALKDRPVAEAVITETVRWMRTEEFRTLFPPEYVRLWEERYRGFLKYYFHPVLRPAVDAISGLARFGWMRPAVEAGETLARRLLLDLPGRKP